MSKRHRRVKIPKDDTMEKLIIKMKEERQEFLNRINAIDYDNMPTNVFDRKTAEMLEEKRQIEYLKAISKIKENENKDESKNICGER